MAWMMNPSAIPIMTNAMILTASSRVMLFMVRSQAWSRKSKQAFS